jgi:hypothetical protein
LTGGVGVPVIAHGKDFVIGFSPERLEMMLESCAHSSPVDITDEE